MRLHSNVITPQQILDALTAEQDAGRVAPSVRFKQRTQHNSQSHARAFEVQLESTWQVRGDGRRAGNSGSYGAMSPDVDNYAATFDEWGWLMAALYRIDPDAVWGSVKHPQYADAEHFHHVTGLTYNPESLLRHLEYGRPIHAASHDVSNDPYPYQHASKIGRYGAGRKSADDAYPGYDAYRPRTAEWVCQFAKLTSEAVHA